MTTPQLVAFWAWWKTGLSGSGKRSFRKTAEETGHSLTTIIKWADEEDWSQLAIEKDHELQGELEDAIFKKLISDNEQILDRQRKLVAKIYEKIAESLDGLRLNLDQIIKLMEYERTLDPEAQGSGSGAGASLNLIMQFLKPEERSGIFRAIGDARREGLELVDRGLVHPGRN